MPSTPGANPFRYEEPVAPDELIDREPELAALASRAREGRNTRLTAPRRFGKTSLLRRLLRDARRDGMAAVYVDLYGVLSVEDVAVRVELAYERDLDGRLRRWYDGFRRTLRPSARVSAGVASLELAAADRPAAAQRALLERLATPRELHERHGTPVVVVFDEFQSLLGAGPELDAVLRSEIQHHGDGVAYVFAGSHPGMMAELFGGRDRPLFDQASPLTIGRLPADALAEHLGERFAASRRDPGDALGPLLDLADGHPQRAMQLAYHLWAATREGARATSDEWSAALAATGREVEDAFRATWGALPATRQRVLAALADGVGELTAAATIARYRTSKGASPGALAALRAAGEVEDDPGSPGGVRIVDPLLARWIAAGRRWEPPGGETGA